MFIVEPIEPRSLTNGHNSTAATVLRSKEEERQDPLPPTPVEDDREGPQGPNSGHQGQPGQTGTGTGPNTPPAN